MPNNFALIKGKILMKFYAILINERTTSPVAVAKTFPWL